MTKAATSDVPGSQFEAAGLLASLRLDVDQQWINHEGEHVWIGPCVRGGKRIGITDCCFVAEPCERHRTLALSHD